MRGGGLLSPAALKHLVFKKAGTIVSLRFLVFGSLFAVATLASVFNPFWGILAYFGHYYLWPEHQWVAVLHY